jgi:peptidoglycan-associated lipoprotein
LIIILTSIYLLARRPATAGIHATPTEVDPMIRPDHRAVLQFAALTFLCASGAACAHHAPPQLAAAPAPAAPAAPKHTTAWEDSVVLAQMAADKHASDLARATAAKDTLTMMTFFDFDQAVLSEKDRTLLDAKLVILEAHPDLQIRIAGDADDRGSEEYNLALGQRRAAAAKRYLVDHGISDARIEIISYGLERPVAKGETEQSWAMNRNDQFLVIAGKLGGGQD